MSAAGSGERRREQKRRARVGLSGEKKGAGASDRIGWAACGSDVAHRGSHGHHGTVRNCAALYGTALRLGSARLGPASQPHGQTHADTRTDTRTGTASGSEPQRQRHRRTSPTPMAAQSTWNRYAWILTGLDWGSG